MSDEWDTVVEAVRKRVEPDDDERTAMKEAIETVTTRLEAALADLPTDADITLAGSGARDTWLAGDRDIDIFVAFPPDTSREDLESYGLTLGHAALSNGREEFAEHPYVVGEYDGFDVDIVPCYDVENATEIQSAVDRTPFHTQYLTERLTPELAADVRVCKQFLTGIGVYGSDLRTQGFSGFLTELLVLEFGGFRPLVEAAADWHPPVRLDPENHGQASFEDPLVVIDPTDPERNVAAVLTESNLARLQHFSRGLLASPDTSYFFPKSVEPLDPSTVRETFIRRETTPVAIRFDPPAVVDDQLWPQLERSRSGIVEELERRGFAVFRSAAFARAETAVLLFELSVADLPAVERHEGPPIHVREHAERFYDAYADSDVTGPFIDGDRYVVERERDHSSVVSFLTSEELFGVGLGTHIRTALESEYELVVGDEVAKLASEFGREFARYLSPTPRG